jgi:hypothetical protein
MSIVTRSLLPLWLVSALLLAASPAVAQQGHEGHAMPRSELGASAAVDAKGVLWAVYKDGEHVVARRSADLGKTWGKPVRVNSAPEPIGADGDARPKIAVGPAGELFVTWTRPLSKPYTGNIRFARSLDGGLTFSAPLTVHKDRQEITHRFDAVTVGRDGKLFVAWVDKRDQEARKPADYRGAAIYFAVSDDRGASFRGDFKLADNSCECCRIALLPRDDGSVLAFWRHVFEPNIRDHALARMTPDGRASGLRRATFDDWRLDACPHHGPSLAADSQGRLHAVWFSGAPGRSGAFYGRLAEGRVEGQRRIGAESAEHPDLAVAGKRIVITWKEFDGERSLLKAMLSDDDGDTWKETRLAATAGASAQPLLLVYSDRFYVFWNTRQEPLSVRTLP